MITKINPYAETLLNLESQMQAGALKSVPHREQREACLVDALRALASHFGVTLAEPLGINSNGEFSLIAKHPDGRPTNMGAGEFGDEFTALLNQHRPRTGVLPGTLSSRNGWCYMHHFDVEAMVRNAATPK